MSTLKNYELRASQPNTDGFCTFRLIDRITGEEIAHTDEPGTLDEAFVMARKFVEELEEEE